MIQTLARYYFKLCGNIADLIEVRFARMEIEGLFPGKLTEIKNFVDVLSNPPLNQFLEEEVRIQDVIMRDVCYGQIQGFQSEYAITDISDLVRRLAYTREIYVLPENENKTPEELLDKLYSAGKIGVDTQFFKSSLSVLFRMICHTYYYENMKPIVFCSFAKSKKRSWERIKENVERLIDHMIEDYYYVPLHPGARLYKEVEDFIDERKEVKLYLSHAFGPPYKAKFHPRMAKAMMNYIGVREGILLDPFVGSGTMSIECTLTGVDSIGVDISPVCILATKAKISSLIVNPEKLRAEIDKLLRTKKAWETGILQQALEMFFEGETYEEVSVPQMIKGQYPGKEKELLTIYRLKNVISKIEDEDIQNIFLCALSKAVSMVMKPKTKKGVSQLFEEEIEEMYKAILGLDELRKRINIELGNSENFIGDVRDLRTIPENRVSGIVTSPPYSTAVDYIKNDLPMLQIIHEANIEQLERDMMGNPRFKDEEKSLLAEIYEGKERFADLPSEAREIIKNLIMHRRKNLGLRQYKFLLDMKLALQQMYRVLKPNSKCVIIIGNNNFKIGKRELEFKNAQYLYEMGSQVGFRPEQIVDRTLLKTSYGAIRREHLLILEKG